MNSDQYSFLKVHRTIHRFFASAKKKRDDALAAREETSSSEKPLWGYEAEREEEERLAKINEQKRKDKALADKLALEEKILELSTPLPGEKQKSERAVAEILGIQKTTVHRVRHGQTNLFSAGPGRKPSLPEASRNLLVAEIVKNEKAGDFLSGADFASLIKRVVKANGGKVAESTGGRMTRKRLNEKLASEAVPFKIQNRQPDPKDEHRDAVALRSVAYGHLMAMKTEIANNPKEGLSKFLGKYGISSHYIFFADETDISPDQKVSPKMRSISVNHRPSVVTSRPRRHLAYLPFLNAYGTTVATCIALSGSANIVPARGPVAPYESLLVINETGSFTSGADGKDGGMLAAMKHFVACLDDKYPTRGQVLLVLDGASTHTTLEVNEFLFNNRVTLVISHPNTTSFLQVQDRNCNVEIQASKRALYSNNAHIREHPEFHIAEIDHACRSALTIPIIRTSVARVGFEYRRNYEAVTITDPGATAFCDKLVADGKIRDDVMERNMTTAKVASRRVATHLGKTGDLPAGVASLVPPGAIAATLEAFAAVRQRKRKRAEPQRRVSAELTAAPGFVSGTHVTNTALMIAAQTKAREQEEAKEQATKKRKLDQEANRAAKAIANEARVVRMSALRGKFPTVSLEVWDGLTRSLSRYVAGTKDLQWAETIVKKKLGKS